MIISILHSIAYITLAMFLLIMIVRLVRAQESIAKSMSELVKKIDCGREDS